MQKDRDFLYLCAQNLLPLTMPTVQLHIQGLTHHDIAERREAFLQTAVGRRIVLRPAQLCEDVRAVEAYVGGECVGVVARLDLELAWSALRGGEKKVLHGRIVSTQEYSLLAEVEAQYLHQEETVASGLDGWTYSGPLLAERAEERKLAFLEEELEALLDDSSEGLSEDDVKEVLELVEVYCNTAYYDISGEGLQFRRKVEQSLGQSTDARLQEGAERVREMSRLMGGDHWMEKLGEWMKAELPTSREALMLTVEAAGLAEVRAEAERLPKGLLTLWNSNPAQFVRVLYGMLPSRKDVRRVLSCLVVLELTGSAQESAEEKVNDFVKRIVEETKHVYKHDRKKADVIRQIMIKVGRSDADAELDAWIEGKEKKKKGTKKIVQKITNSQIFNGSITDSEFNGGGTNNEE